MRRFGIFVLVAISGIALAVSAVTAAETSTNAPTAEAIVRDLGIAGVKTPHLLVFKAQVDERPLYVESALLAIECATNKWYLTHVYRHPKEKVEHFHRCT